MKINNTFEQFSTKLVNRLKDYYGDEYLVTISEVMKNNGNIRHALLIRREEETLAPNIYIDDLYDEYLSGSTFSEIISGIIDMRDDLTMDIHIDLDFLEDYELVKDKLAIRLVGKENNELLLADVPHTDFYDMSTIYYINMDQDVIGKGAILIHNNLMRDWDITIERLHYDARENMMKNNPPLRHDIVDMLIDMYVEHNNDGSSYAKEELDEYVKEMEATRNLGRRMFVLTNQDKMYGASVLVYPGMLDELAESFESDYYLLPSSIHEVILIPCSEDENGRELSEMVRMVNETDVDVEEILSNHAYRYHRTNHWLEALNY